MINYNLFGGCYKSISLQGIKNDKVNQKNKSSKAINHGFSRLNVTNSTCHCHISYQTHSNLTLLDSMLPTGLFPLHPNVRKKTTWVHFVAVDICSLQSPIPCWGHLQSHHVFGYVSIYICRYCYANKIKIAGEVQGVPSGPRVTRFWMRFSNQPINVQPQLVNNPGGIIIHHKKPAPAF